MLTQRSRYALRAMLFLAEAPAASPPIPMGKIAVAANVPRKFLELILADLRDAGFIQSTRGKMGGYVLARPAHLISLGDVIRVIEGPLALVPCVSRTAYRRCNDCRDEATCAIRHEPRMACGDFLALRDAAAANIGVAFLPDHVCKADLMTGRLVQVFPEWRSEDGIVHIVFTTRRGLPPAVRAFIDHLAAMFSQDRPTQ